MPTPDLTDFEYHARTATEAEFNDGVRIANAILAVAYAIRDTAPKPGPHVVGGPVPKPGERTEADYLREEVRELKGSVKNLVAWGAKVEAELAALRPRLKCECCLQTPCACTAECMCRPAAPPAQEEAAPKPPTEAGTCGSCGAKGFPSFPSKEIGAAFGHICAVCLWELAKLRQTQAELAIDDLRAVLKAEQAEVQRLKEEAETESQWRLTAANELRAALGLPAHPDAYLAGAIEATRPALAEARAKAIEECAVAFEREWGHCSAVTVETTLKTIRALAPAQKGGDDV